MKYIEDVEKKVADALGYFRDNRATLTRHDSIEVLDWRRPNTVVCSVRMVFDAGRTNAVYITGDLGAAIIRPTCKAALVDMASCFTRWERGSLKVNCGYFMEKIAAASDLYEWSQDAFVEDFKNRCEEYQLTPPDDFLDDRDGYFSPVEFFDDRPPVVSGDAKRDLEEMDGDYWEWFYDCGKRVSSRVVAWLVTLRLAVEQIGKQQDAASNEEV